MAYDVASVRGLYTSLSDGWTYLNAHDCPQIPERVSSAVARSFRLAPSVPIPDGRGGSHSRQTLGRPEADNLLAGARHAVADLVGASADCVVLGPSLPVLYSALVAAMSPQFRSDSSLIVSPLDRPELTAALCTANVQVRAAHADLGTGEAPAWQYKELVDGTSRLISLPAAHPQLGIATDVAGIVDIARDRSRAWVAVDASAYAPYYCINFDEWGADIIGVDLGQLGGPQLSALVFRDSAMFNRLTVDPLRLAGLGLSPGLAGGVPALVDHLANLGPVPEGRSTRRARLVASMEELSAYLRSLRDDLYTFLGTWPDVHILGASGEAAADATMERLPRLTFGVQGVPAATVHERLFDNGIITTLANPTPLLTDMGLEEMGGAVTVGLGPFNTYADIEQLIRVVASLA